MKQHQVVINTNKCIGCGLCAKVCVAHNIAIKKKKAETVLNDCIMCGQCTAVCPKKAISLSGYDSGQIDKSEDIHLKPGEVLDVIRFRRSIRRFKEKEVKREAIEQILEAGRLTHTAKNMQDVSFVVLSQEKNRIEQMAVGLFRRLKPLANLLSPMARHNRIDENFFFWGAPVVIVILAKDRTNGILAAQNMEFVAEAHGLGVLFSGYFTMAANASHRIKRALKVPKDKRVAMTLVLGYPDVKFLRSVQRKKLDARYM